MGLHQIKKFLHCKGNKCHSEEGTSEWVEIFASYSSDKGFISRMYKELKELNTKRTSNPIHNWANELNR
jgi:hypothetical protein